MERSPNVAIIPHHGQGHVRRANHTANVPVGMGDSGGATPYPPRRPTRRRRDVTNRRLLATPGRWQPRRQLRQPVPTRRTIPTRTKTITAWTSPKEARHPKIEALMDPLLAKDFRISVKTVCRAGNMPMYELPTLPKYRDSTG
jgi:hypothetical protein